MQVSGAGTRLNAALTLGQAFGPAAHGEGGVTGPLPSGVASNTSRYYSVDVGLVHFVALDMNAYYFSTEARYIKPQLDWLAADLKVAAANREAVPWIVVMAHHPMYCSSITLAPMVHTDGSDGHDQLGTFQGCTGTGEQTVNKTRVDLEPLFMQYGVDVFFAGEDVLV